jgi:hypothetical protein
VLNVVYYIKQKIVGLNVDIVMVWDILKINVGSKERMGRQHQPQIIIWRFW